MGSPGPRGRHHVWQPIAAPAGEPATHTFDGCPCGAQRRGMPGARHGKTYAYRQKGQRRWQEKSPWCDRPIAEPVVSKRQIAAGGGR